MVTQKPTTTRRPKKAKLKPLGQALREIADSIPPEAWEGFPTDAAANFDDLIEPEWIDDRPVTK